MAITEPSISLELGKILQSLRRTSWEVASEETRQLEGGGQPDVLVSDGSGWPVVIEAEKELHAQAEREALDRLGRVTSGGRDIESVIALVYPPEVRDASSTTIESALRETTALEYALYSRRANLEPEWLPESGWLTGSVKDLADPTRLSDLASQNMYTAKVASTQSASESSEERAP